MRLIQHRLAMVTWTLLVAISLNPVLHAEEKLSLKEPSFSNANTRLMGDIDFKRLKELGFQPPNHNGEKALVYYHKQSESLMTFIKHSEKGVVMVTLAGSEQKLKDSVSHLGPESTLVEMFTTLFPEQAVPDFIKAANSPGNISKIRFGVFGADCSFESDGSMFDNLWQSLGWTFHHYSNANSTVTTPIVTTSALKTHLCHYDPDSPGGFLVYQPMHQLWTRTPRPGTLPGFDYNCIIGQYVPPGTRSFIQVFNDHESWFARGYYGPFSEGMIRLGIMAP